MDKETLKDRDKKWVAFIGTAAGPTNIELPKDPEDCIRFLKEVFEFREAAHIVIADMLRDQVRSEQDTKTLIQKGSTAELQEHREYKAEVRVLLAEILFNTEKLKIIDPIFKMVPRIQELMNR